GGRSRGRGRARRRGRVRAVRPASTRWPSWSQVVDRPPPGGARGHPVMCRTDGLASPLANTRGGLLRLVCVGATLATPDYTPLATMRRVTKGEDLPCATPRPGGARCTRK